MIYDYYYIIRIVSNALVDTDFLALVIRCVEGHSVISPQNCGEKSGFSKGFCQGGSHFSKCLGRKGFGVGFEFSDFCLEGKSDF